MSPYRVTPVFTEETLPAALRREHSTKEGVWGIVRILEGRLRISFVNGAVHDLDPSHPGSIAPGQLHHVEPLGPMRMQVEFYDAAPPLA